LNIVEIIEGLHPQDVGMGLNTRAALGVIEEVGNLAGSHLMALNQMESYDNKWKIILGIQGFLGQLALAEMKRGGDNDRACATIECDALCAIGQLLELYQSGYKGSTQNMFEDIWVGTNIKDGPSYPETTGQPTIRASDAVIKLTQYASCIQENFHATLVNRVYEQLSDREGDGQHEE